MNYQQWRARFPAAAADLERMITADVQVGGAENHQLEAKSQQEARRDIAAQGAMSWRNNVGATKAVETHVCPQCHMKFREKKQPVRYGLCNDHPALNGKIKSADLILAIPRIITREMVGQKIAQFGSVEVKRPGFKFNPKDPALAAQAKWAYLIRGAGGFAVFSTGSVNLSSR